MVEAEPDRLSRVLRRIAQKKDTWFAMDDAKKLIYLEGILRHAQNLSFESWGHETAIQNGHMTETTLGKKQAGFDMLSTCSIVLTLIKEHIWFYKSHTQIPKEARPSRNGRHYHLVSPIKFSDQFQPNRTIRAEVWTNDGLDETPKTPGFCLVLGAGNQPFLSFADMMHQLFVQRHCCILKHHPLRSYCDSYFAHLFQDLIRDGFVECVEANLEHTEIIINHSSITHVHMTGGTSTHDAIVWGENPNQQEANKLSHTPILKKPMTSELGCVTPWLICSGARWSEKELWHHAGQLAIAFTHNDSFNCLAAKVVVIDEDWPQADDFINKLRTILQQVERPASYYPGAQSRYDEFLRAYPTDSVEIIQSTETPKSIDVPSLPWTLLHLDSTSSDYALQNEAFAPVLAIYKLHTDNNPEQYLQQATRLANRQIWGSLSCTVLAHPTIRKTNSQAFDQCIHQLRYGTIGVNLWTAQCYAITRTAWGAYPGNRLDNVGSGIGFVNNPFQLERIEKSVVYAPFVDVNQISVNQTGQIPISYEQSQAIVNLLQKPSIGRIAKVIWSQMQQS
ncbi:MAG: aldehyde dehydrogenase family protein [Myxococcota bacterium]